MSTIELVELIDKLPVDKQKAVENFVHMLSVESVTNKLAEVDTAADTPGKTPKLKREFGSLKGFVTYMADDFDAPLKEFHDYMYNIDIEFIEKIERLPVSKQRELEAIVDTMYEKL